MQAEAYVGIAGDETDVTMEEVVDARTAADEGVDTVAIVDESMLVDSAELVEDGTVAGSRPSISQSSDSTESSSRSRFATAAAVG